MPGARPTTSRKNRSVGDICTALDISCSQYALVSEALQSEMAKAEMLGAHLNTLKTKASMRQVYQRVYDNITYLKGIPEKRRHNAMTALAQKCNYNERRRKSIKKNKDAGVTLATLDIETARGLDYSARASSTDSKSGDGDDEINCSSIGTILVEIRRLDQPPVLYRPCEFLLTPKASSTSISIDNLQFERLIRRIKHDLGFNEKLESLVYDCSGEARTIVTTEYTWKAALQEMYSKKTTRFYFGIMGIPFTKQR